MPQVQSGAREGGSSIVVRTHTPYPQQDWIGALVSFRDRDFTDSDPITMLRTTVTVLYNLFFV